MTSDASAIGRAPSPWTGRALLRRLALGDEVAHLVTLIFAFSIILITSLLVYQLWLQSALLPPCVRLALLGLAHLGSGIRALWSSAVHLWHSGHFGCFSPDRPALGLGGGGFSFRARSAQISDTISFLIDLLAAVPSVILRDSGNFRRCALHADDDRSGGETYFWISAAVSRTELWCGIF